MIINVNIDVKIRYLINDDDIINDDVVADNTVSLLLLIVDVQMFDNE